MRIQKPWKRRARISRKSALAYQGAMEALIALAMGFLVGYWLDGKYGTSPRYFLIGTAIGFASFSVRLIRLGRKLGDGTDDSTVERGDEGDDGSLD